MTTATEIVTIPALINQSEPRRLRPSPRRVPPRLRLTTSARGLDRDRDHDHGLLSSPGMIILLVK